MAKIRGRKKRAMILRQKRKRKEKIKKLKEKFAKAKTQEEKDKIISKILKISPSYPIESLRLQ